MVVMDIAPALLTCYIVLVAVVTVTCAQMTDSEIMAYLNQYGYGEDNPDPRVAALMTSDQDEAMAIGCMIFQAKYGLNMTGDCRDNATQELMTKPRCGMKDVKTMEDMMSYETMMGMRNDPRRTRRYVLQGSYWTRPGLTYSIGRYTEDLANSEVDRDIVLAFRVWSDVTPLTFTRVDENPNIQIVFTPRRHGDGADFDGPSGTLAHAFYPQFGGDAHFDEDEEWTVNTPRGINLFQVAAHEFGHALGLDHSEDMTALMAPFYQGYVPVGEFQLSNDDIRGIQALYGTNEMTLPPPSAAAPTRRTPVIPEGAPDICRDVKFDAIFHHVVDGILRTFAFYDEYYMEIKDFSIVSGYPKRIADDWSGVTRVDAALTVYRGFNGNERDTFTALFSGSQWFVYNNMQLQQDSPRSIVDGWGIPDDLDAAFQMERNGLIYFIKGSEYYRFSTLNQRQPDTGYPRPLSTWGSSLTTIDAAFQFDRQKTYFFVDDQYYRFNDTSLQVIVESRGSIQYDWLSCSLADDTATDATAVLRASLASVPVGVMLAVFTLEQRRNHAL